MKAQDDGDGGPDKDVDNDENGDDSNAVGGNRVKKLWLCRKFDGREVRRHGDADNVKTQNIAEVTCILDLGDLSLKNNGHMKRIRQVFKSSAAPSLAYNPSLSPS